MLQVNQDAAAELLENPETFGLVVALILDATIDHAVLIGLNDGEPLDALTVFHEMERRYSVTLPESIQNRLQAVLTLWTTEAYEVDPMAFTGITLALTEGYLGDLVTGEMEELDSQAVMWSLFEAAAIDGHLLPLEPDVQNLIVSVLEEPGEDDGEDPAAEMLENIEELRSQLLRLDIPRSLIDDLIQRGLDALPDSE